MLSQLIANRYRVLREVGRGGMGTVWLCNDETLHWEVAVKGLNAQSADGNARASREARLGAGLRHPNAVAVHDVLMHEGQPWLVMEYVDGQSLAEAISRSGRLAPGLVAGIAVQVAGALAHAHERGIVHRDIKPANILIDKAGCAKIGDFGIARGHDDEHLTLPGYVIGTRGYLSPEVAQGGPFHPPSDVWAFGATLYAAVEGQPPYELRSACGPMARGAASAHPWPMTHAGPLAPAIAAMLQEDPARRWDMKTCVEQLARIAGDDATWVDAPQTRISSDATRVQAEPPTEEARRERPAAPSPRYDKGRGRYDKGRGWRWTASAVAAALLALVVVGLVGFVLMTRNSDPPGGVETFTCEADGFTGYIQFSNASTPVVSYKIDVGDNAGGDSADVRVTDGGVTPPISFQTDEGLQDGGFHALEGPYSRGGGGLSFTFVFDKSNRDDPTCSGERYFAGAP